MILLRMIEFYKNVFLKKNMYGNLFIYWWKNIYDYVYVC